MPPSLDTWINDRQVLRAIASCLQDNLEDPREQYTNSSRSWVHTDKPLTSATFPRIQVSKQGPTQTKKISLGRGDNYIEWRIMIVTIRFWTETGFKWKDSTNTYHVDEELVKEYLDKAWRVLKAQEQSLYDTYGITGFKPIDESDAFIEPDTQLYTGILTMRVWYFRK